MELFLIFHLLLLNYFAIGTSISSISQTKCVEYGNIVTTNQTVDDASPRAFPFMVKIYANISNSKQFLNGILISENFVLSTASGIPESPNAVVMLRDLRPGVTLDNITSKTYDVLETFVHPSFNTDNLSSNIKLFKLNESITFGDSVRPVCLPPFDLSIPKDMVLVGWGDKDADVIDYLYSVKSNVITNENCKTSYESASASKFVSNIDNVTIFCARPEKVDPQMCDRYAGSGLISVNQNASDNIVGFASYSLKYDDECTTIFVRVSAFIDWIEDIVWYGKTHLATTTAPTAYLSVGGTKSNTNENSTEPSQSIDDNKSNTTDPKIPNSESNTTTIRSDLSVSVIKTNGTEPGMPTIETNTNTTERNLTVGGTKSNATEPARSDSESDTTRTKPEVPVSERNTSTANPNLSVGDIKSNKTELEISASEAKANTTQLVMPDSGKISNDTSNDGETMISNTTIMVILISVILCVSYVVYLEKRKSRQRRSSNNNYYSCYYDNYGENAALIDSKV